MGKYTLIGHPLGHSMSPFIHERLFRLSGKEDCTYDLTDIAPEALADRADGLRMLDGFNITIPHKVSILPLLDRLDASAERYQAANCVSNHGGVLTGYNTDCDGFLRCVSAFPMDSKVLLTGIGGAGKMMATESILHGAELTLGILPRQIEKAAALTRELLKQKPDAVIHTVLLSDLKPEYEVLLNATPVGMYPNVDGCPLPARIIRGASYVFDAVYNPTDTVLIQLAHMFGKTAVGGAAMLVLQAARAHEIWYGGAFTEEQLSGIIAEMEAYIAVTFQ